MLRKTFINLQSQCQGFEARFTVARLVESTRPIAAISLLDKSTLRRRGRRAKADFSTALMKFFDKINSDKLSLTRKLFSTRDSRFPVRSRTAKSRNLAIEFGSTKVIRLKLKSTDFASGTHFKYEGCKFAKPPREKRKFVTPMLPFKNEMSRWERGNLSSVKFLSAGKFCKRKLLMSEITALLKKIRVKRGRLKRLNFTRLGSRCKCTDSTSPFTTDRFSRVGATGTNTSMLREGGL